MIPAPSTLGELHADLAELEWRLPRQRARVTQSAQALAVLTGQRLRAEAAYERLRSIEPAPSVLAAARARIGHLRAAEERGAVVRATQEAMLDAIVTAIDNVRTIIHQRGAGRP